jgi:hypothetical protein
VKGEWRIFTGAANASDPTVFAADNASVYLVLHEDPYPLPTASLTLHLNASDGTNVWQVWQAGTPYHTTAGADGAVVETWEDATGGDRAAIFIAAGSRPLYRVTTPLMALPAIDFDGTDDQLELRSEDAISSKLMSDRFTASGKTIIAAIYVEALTENDAAWITNPAIVGETAQYFGLNLRTPSGGVYKLAATNWDTNFDTVEVDISLATSYVVMVRHDGTNLYLSLNGGAESSVASGATADVTGAIRFGMATGSPSRFFNGRIGELAFWNAALTGTPQTDAVGYFTTKWLPAGGPATTGRLLLMGVGGP